MNTIAKPSEIRLRGRQIGKIEEEKLQSFINEVEMTIIRKRLGDALYIQLTTTEPEQLSEDLTVLIDGGAYTHDSKDYLLVGLKTAIAYYVYAQIVLAGDFESTRYGIRIKDDDYSQSVTQKDRATLAGNATDIANVYMAECLEYMVKKGIIFDNGKDMMLTSGCIIRKIKEE